MTSIHIPNHRVRAAVRALPALALTVLTLAAPSAARATGETGSYYVPSETVVPASFPVRADLGIGTTDAYVTIEPAGDPGARVSAPGCGDDVVILPMALPPGAGPNTFQCTLDASSLGDGAHVLTLFVTTDDGAVQVDTKSVTIDTIPPAGGSITYPNAPVSATPIMVSWAGGSDANVGGVLRLDRWSASLTAGVCGAFAYDSTLDHNLRPTGPSGIFDDTTATAAQCYRYVLVDHDLAGNTHDITSSNTVKFEQPDVTAPTVPSAVIIDTVGVTGAHVAGLPAGTGSVRIAWGASADAGAGVGAYQWCLMDAVRTTCSSALYSGGTTELFDVTPSTPLLEAGKSYVACVRAGDLESNWSDYGCSAVAAIAATSTPPVVDPPKPTACTPKVGASMTRTVGLADSYIYSVGDWASCPFPDRDRLSEITYQMCTPDSVLQCYQVRHVAKASAAGSQAGTLAIPLVGGEVFGDVNSAPSVRLFSNTKKPRAWVVRVTARSITGATFLMHTWQLSFGARAVACDQSPMSVIADSASDRKSFTAAASIVCSGSGFTYSTKVRSAFAAARVDTKGGVRYSAASPAVDTDTFAIVAEGAGGTFERNVTVQFKRYATGTGAGDTMIGSNSNSTTAAATRAKRLTARGDVLLGGGGNDTIHGRGGDDVIHGQVGNDTLHPGAGANVTDGGAGNDAIFVVSARDIVIGGAGNDMITIRTKAMPKRIICGAGRDTIVAPKKIRLPKGCERLVVRPVR